MFLITKPIKFFIYFSLSFLILSFPVNKKPIFFHLDKYTAPYTQNLFSFISKKIDSSLKTSKNITKKMISNSSKRHADKVELKQSALQKKTKKALTRIRKERNHIKKEEHETYTQEEQDALNRILNAK